jgi:hypothetical protein
MSQINLNKIIILRRFEINCIETSNRYLNILKTLPFDGIITALKKKNE